MKIGVAGLAAGCLLVGSFSAAGTPPPATAWRLVLVRKSGPVQLQVSREGHPINTGSLIWSCSQTPIEHQTIGGKVNEIAAVKCEDGKSIVASAASCTLGEDDSDNGFLTVSSGDVTFTLVLQCASRSTVKETTL
jgi:hypothetical protein